VADLFAHPGVTPVTLPLADPAEPHDGCVHAAALATPKGDLIWYPCRSHDGGVHHFAACWPACPAPWCRLPNGHRGLHDIPSGTVEIHDAIGVVEHGC
jgi:hypothetical protein